jgi:hypothetical protein
MLARVSGNAAIDIATKTMNRKKRGIFNGTPETANTNSARKAAPSNEINMMENSAFLVAT